MGVVGPSLFLVLFCGSIWWVLETLRRVWRIFGGCLVYGFGWVLAGVGGFWQGLVFFLQVLVGFGDFWRFYVVFGRVFEV